MSDLVCKVLDHLISNVAPWLVSSGQLSGRIKGANCMR